ncbi:MAG: hypothetical protein HOV80_32195, partial [Polyangiaceae bacterium]|nr:hypothetical protein [Polyangiaceae bacterium]
MGRRIGLVLLVLFAGCDAEVTRVRTKEPQSREPVPAPEPTEPKPKDPTGPLPKPDPTYRTLDLRVVAKDVGAGVPNVEVVSNLAVGSHLDRRQTSADGTAVIEVEDGGTISILSEVTWIDGTQERVIETFLVTAALTSIVHEVSGITIDRNPPVEHVLDMNGTPE